MIIDEKHMNKISSNLTYIGSAMVSIKGKEILDFNILLDLEHIHDDKNIEIDFKLKGFFYDFISFSKDMNS